MVCHVSKSSRILGLQLDFFFFLLQVSQTKPAANPIKTRNKPQTPPHKPRHQSARPSSAGFWMPRPPKRRKMGLWSPRCSRRGADCGGLWLVKCWGPKTVGFGVAFMWFYVALYTLQWFFVVILRQDGLWGWVVLEQKHWTSARHGLN